MYLVHARRGHQASFLDQRLRRVGGWESGKPGQRAGWWDGWVWERWRADGEWSFCHEA